MKTAIVVVALACAAGPASAKRAISLQEAIDQAEDALDNGRFGDAITMSERLLKSHGLKKEEQARVDVIVARCKLVEGNYQTTEKLLARRYKDADDTRLAEWYARALDGAGKGEAALSLLSELAKKDAIKEGDSYWTLAQLERKRGDKAAAREHAKLALEKPIVFQSEELDRAIHRFIDELGEKRK